MDCKLQEKINIATINMYQWLNTWCQNDGAYNSFVVHRYDLKRLKYIHDTPWGHCAIIEGLITLYEKNNWYDLQQRIEKAVILQMSHLDCDASFINAGFEDDRFSSLVHNSMADRALLAYYKYSGALEITKKKALDTVTANVQEYLIGKLWDDTVGAFKFSKVDYYSPHQTRFVANMNCVAVEVLISLAEITGNSLYLNYAETCGNWLKTQIIVDKNLLRNGGISYGSTNPQNLVSIYTGLCLPGVCRLYEQFHDNDYKKIAVDAANNLLTYTCEGYFCHALEGDTELKYPYFLAGAGIILYGIQYVERSLNVSYQIDIYIQKILEHQLSNGAVENFLHYNSASNNRMNANSNMITWEDVVPCLAWNAQLFRFLSINTENLDRKLLQFNTSITKVYRSFFYYENANFFYVMSWRPLRSVALLVINKKCSVSLIAFTLKSFYNNVKQKLKGLLK